MKCIGLFAVLILLGRLELPAQRLADTSIAPYLGTWRWVSGKRDTLIMRIVRPDGKQRPLRNSNAQILGFHSFTAGATLIESNLKMEREADTIANHASIGGSFVHGQMNITLWDITYNDYLRGSFTLLPFSRERAILELREPGEQSVYRNPEPYRNARTVPNNIVLQKID